MQMRMERSSTTAGKSPLRFLNGRKNTCVVFFISLSYAILYIHTISIIQIVIAVLAAWGIGISTAFKVFGGEKKEEPVAQA